MQILKYVLWHLFFFVYPISFQAACFLCRRESARDREARGPDQESSNPEGWYVFVMATVMGGGYTSLQSTQFLLLVYN